MNTAAILPAIHMRRAEIGTAHKDSAKLIFISRFLFFIIIYLDLLAVAHINHQQLTQAYYILFILSYLIAINVGNDAGIYRIRKQYPFFKAIKNLAWNWSIVAASLIMIGQITETYAFFPKEIIISWLISTPVFLLSSQFLAWYIINHRFKDKTVKKAVIIGANQLSCDLSQKIADDHLDISIEAFFDDRTDQRLPKKLRNQVSGTLAEVADFVKKHKTDLVFIALPMVSQPRIHDLLESLTDTTASISFVPDVSFFDLLHARFDHFKGIPTLTIRDTPFHGMNSFIKRASDVILASLILLLISPIMIAVAIGVKLSSSGPILFHQRRYGLHGNEVVVYKFRSMTVTEDGDRNYLQVTKNDPRVTKFGAFIRKTSLDELPQFINVVQGRMSLVGPRPHAIAVNEQYRRLIRGYMYRHKVKPGITGLAQVNGFRGGDDLEHMRGRIACDLEYIRNWSFGLDLWIIFRTTKLMLSDKNAY
ncbi:MAG: undecaprenyl-phosphate glucose phosphotransferase [Methylomonas sp.]|jgi:putative colanic acid biosynthesis UDP-glucose lipid carrier transferase